MRYNIEMISAYEAVKRDVCDVEEEYVLISICCVTENNHKFRNPKLKEVLNIKFDDVTPQIVARGSKCTVMTEEQAVLIREFIDKHKDTVTNIIVHCAMGVSRSGAVGCTIARYLNGDDTYLFRLGRYRPNEHVYRLMCTALDLDFNKKKFKIKCNVSFKKCKKDLKGYGDFGLDLDDMFTKQ